MISNRGLYQNSETTIAFMASKRVHRSLSFLFWVPVGPTCKTMRLWTGISIVFLGKCKFEQATSNTDILHILGMVFCPKKRDCKSGHSRRQLKVPLWSWGQKELHGTFSCHPWWKETVARRRQFSATHMRLHLLERMHFNSSRAESCHSSTL